MENGLVKITDKQIRAKLLEVFGWDISEDNELFPFVKLFYLSRFESYSESKELKAMVEELSKKVDGKKTVRNKFENNWLAFMHGFGQFGFPLLIAIMCVFVIYIAKMQKEEKVVVAKPDPVETIPPHHKKTKSIKKISNGRVTPTNDSLEIKPIFIDSTFGIGKNTTAFFNWYSVS